MTILPCHAVECTEIRYATSLFLSLQLRQTVVRLELLHRPQGVCKSHFPARYDFAYVSPCLTRDATSPLQRFRHLRTWHMHVRTNHRSSLLPRVAFFARPDFHSLAIVVCGEQAHPPIPILSSISLSLSFPSLPFLLSYLKLPVHY